MMELLEYTQEKSAERLARLQAEGLSVLTIEDYHNRFVWPLTGVLHKDLGLGHPMGGNRFEVVIGDEIVVI